MNEEPARLADRATTMRQAFDQSFAEARSPDLKAGEDLLAIRVGPEPYALRLSEIGGLFADRKIVQIPGGTPALLGIAGFRGAIVPVYDLDQLLGHRPVRAWRWLAMAAGTRVAFAIDTLDGLLHVAPGAIVRQQADRQPRQHVREFACTAELVRPIVYLRSILDAVRQQVPSKPNTKER
jgi:purine-binding chemotaxis protein CheW